MPSSIKDDMTLDFEYVYFFTKSKKYYFETQYEPHTNPEKYGKGTKSKGSKYDENNSHIPEGRRGVDTGVKLWSRYAESGLPPQGRNKRSVWRITTKPFREAHFATYPEALCETPIKAGCPVGGIVLDPFFGAGTTGLVALKQNKNFIGIELNPEYIKIAEARIHNA